HAWRRRTTDLFLGGDAVAVALGARGLWLGLREGYRRVRVNLSDRGWHSSNDDRFVLRVQLDGRLSVGRRGRGLHGAARHQPGDSGGRQRVLATLPTA